MQKYEYKTETKWYTLANEAVVTEKEMLEMLRNGTLTFGVYHYHYRLLKQTFSTGVTPAIEPNVRVQMLNNLNQTINQFKSGEIDQNELRAKIKENPHLALHFIETLLERFQNDSKLQELFDSFVDCGGQFLHLIDLKTPFNTLLILVSLLGPHRIAANQTHLHVKIGDLLQKNQIDDLKKLLAAGVPFTALENNFNGTILHNLLACQNIRSLECLEIIASLHQTYPFDFTICDKEGKTAFMIAVKTGNIKVVKKLIALHKKGFNIGLNIADQHGRTPIMIAAGMGFSFIVAELLNVESDLTCVDQSGKTVVDYCHLNELQMRELFFEIFIHPDRDAMTEASYLYAIWQSNTPLMVRVSPDGEEAPIVCSTKPRYLKIIFESIKYIKQNDPEHFRWFLASILPVFYPGPATPVSLALMQNLSNPNLTNEQLDWILSDLSKQLPKSQSILEKNQQNKEFIKIAIQQRLHKLFSQACAAGDIETVQKLLSMKFPATFNLFKEMPFLIIFKAELIIKQTLDASSYKNTPFKTAVESHATILDLCLKNFMISTDKTIDLAAVKIGIMTLLNHVDSERDRGLRLASIWNKYFVSDQIEVAEIISNVKTLKM